MRFKALAALAAVIFSAGCQYSPDALDRTIAYNRAVSGSTNQLLLLNVVRASERLPTYYSRLEGDSASLGLSPTASLGIPLAKSRSLEGDVNATAAGVITGSTLKSVATLAGLAATLGLQATESNLLTLQTLDDQKYQNGIMSPVPLMHIQAFQDEGYQRDLLFLMFMSSVRLSEDLLGPIDNAVVARCGELGLPSGALRTFSLAQQICAYIAGNPYQRFFTPAGAAPGPNFAFSLRTCLQDGGAIRDDRPGNMVTFTNDPAREPSRAMLAPHPAVCFQILLNDLLVLGLRIGSAEDIPFELVDTVPAEVAGNPAFRAQMIQQKYALKQTAGGMWAICRKKEQDNGFTLTFIDPVPAALTRQDPLSMLLQHLTPQRMPNAPSDCEAKNPVPQEAAPPAGVNPNLDLQAVIGTGDEAAGAAKPVKLSSDKVAFSTRSFEAMIYYLGEALRYEQSDNSDSASFIRVLGRNPAVAGQNYYETMFFASTHLSDTDAAVSVKDDSGATYAVPNACVSLPVQLSSERNVGCTVEYPDNESLQLLTFLNQVWGLQKESVASPGLPGVVINP